MNAPATLEQLRIASVALKLDGRSVTAFEGETILSVATREGIAIPRLCFKEGYRPDGNCRACVVEVAGERVLAPSCCRTVAAGMDVKTGSDRARKSQQMVLELLLADMPDAGFKWNDGDADRSAWRTERMGQGRGCGSAARAARIAPAVGRARHFASRHGGQPRRLHPMHPLRARLPRRAGQRRHRLRVARRRQQDRVRPGRSRWATAHVSPAANACRRVRPAR